ncbi:putative mitochondrial protein, partial [Tanacetum coccineum]
SCLVLNQLRVILVDCPVNVFWYLTIGIRALSLESSLFSGNSITPATRAIASTSNNDKGDVGARLRSVEESLAQVTRALQEMNQRLNGNGRIQNKNQFTRMTKVDFPNFLGDDVKGQFIRLNGETVSWNVYKKGILERFGTVFDDPISKIRKIKYQSSAKDYQDAFDTLLSRLDVSEEHDVSFYLTGFPVEIEIGVRMFRPTTLANAYRSTNYQEATLEAMRKKNKVMVNYQQGRFGGGGNGYGSNVKPALLPLPSSNSNGRNKLNTPVATLIRKNMTQKEYQEKRAQNLCFYYDQKYTPGHKCSGKLYSMVLLADEELDSDEEYMEKESLMPEEWLEGMIQDKEFESTANTKLLMLCVYPNTGVNLINMEGQTKVGEIGSELSLVVDTFADVHPPMPKDAIEVMVKELLDSGVIKLSNSPFASPIVMVKKKDNTWRMCVDYRHKSLKDHEHHLSYVLATMRQHKLFAKKSKCVFGTSQVEYLRHVISAQGVATDPTKIKAMQEWPIPSNVKQLRGFLGLTGYYRRFKMNFASVNRPLTQLLKKGGYKWSDEAQAAFETLKSAMQKAPVLALPNFSKPFEIETDASGGQEVVNRCLEGYLRCITGEHLKEWAKWLSLAELWYNSNFHTSIQAIPFETVYVILPPIHVPYLGGLSKVEAVDRTLKDREEFIQTLKFHLLRAQNRMKQQANKGRSERQFGIGYWVLLKLQPNRQVTLKGYKGELPRGQLIDIPLCDPDGKLAAQPLKNLDRKMVKKKNVVVVYGLVQWTNGNIEDATWEPLDKLSKDYPGFDLNS